MNLPGPSVWYWLASISGVGVSATGAYLLARWSPRWFLAAASALSMAAYLLFVPSRFPPLGLLNPDVPPVFLNYFWHWVLAFALGVVLSLVMLVRELRSARASRVDEGAAGLSGRFPELAEAWREIEVRLGQARIDPGARDAVLIVAPGEEDAAALVDATGAPTFARAPDAPAPVHAFATADAVLVTASGASAFGTQAPDGAERMAALGGLIREWDPGCPPLRGVVVVFPIGWAGQPDSVRWAAAVRDDLQALHRAVEVRCPVFAVFTEMDSAPGFAEFLGRMPDSYKQGRCGFALPPSRAFGGELAGGGLDWMTGWFHGWALHLMAEDLLDHAGNRRLFELGQEFRRYRKRLRALLEVAFSTHPDAEPVPLRGCYFAATGGVAEGRAFASAVLAGPHNRVLAERASTCWTARAVEDDRAYRRAATAVGGVGALLSLLGWAAILGLSRNPWWTAGPLALVALWAVALVRLRRW